MTATLDVLELAIGGGIPGFPLDCDGPSTRTKLLVESLLIFSPRALKVSFASDLRRNQSMTFLAAELDAFLP
jgi:hypothetical protein